MELTDVGESVFAAERIEKKRVVKVDNLKLNVTLYKMVPITKIICRIYDYLSLCRHCRQCRRLVSTPAVDFQSPLMYISNFLGSMRRFQNAFPFIFMIGSSKVVT